MTRAKAKPQRLKWIETPDGATCVAGEYAATIVFPTEVRLYRGGVRVEAVRRFRHAGGSETDRMSCLDHGKEIARRWIRKQQKPGLTAFEEFLKTAQVIEAPPAWRPIETAPRDEETEIIVGHADWRTPAFVRWTLKPWWHVGRWVDEAGRIHYDPTHWLPLSALPAVPR